MGFNRDRHWGFDINNLIIVLETESNKVIKWLAANRLIINLSKTQSMLFTNKTDNPSFQLQIQNIDIEVTNKCKFLGVIIDDKLLWKDHINYISNKISKSIGILKFLRYIYPKPILRMIYMSLIYSYLNYCNLIWGSASMTALEPIFLLQKKAVRIINKSKYLDETALIFKSLNILTIHQIFKLSCLVFIYKYIKSEKFPEMKK